MEKNRFRVEYYIKGMHPTKQRAVLFKLRKNFPDIYFRWLGFFKDDYEHVYEIMTHTGFFYDKDSVDSFLKECTDLFVEINDIMIESKYKPLFEHVDLLYHSWEQRNRLLEFLPESALNEEFGCESFYDYDPPKLGNADASLQS